MAISAQLSVLLDNIRDTVVPISRGEVLAMDGTLIEGSLPGAKVGAHVIIMSSDIERTPLPAEIVACTNSLVKMAPFRRPVTVGAGCALESAPLPHHVPCGFGLLGRVVDALGSPIDDQGEIRHTQWFSLDRPAPNPLFRPAVTKQLQTGIRVVDGCLGLGVGQRIGLFAGPGLGKSTLLGMIAQKSMSDVNVVCLVGERGREVGPFLKDVLKDGGLARSVVVVATADAPPMARIRAVSTATAMAEWFRNQGGHVLLLVDSLTRMVRARREVALALGERAERGGFPSSAFATLPGLVERTGNTEHGSITAIYSVLTEGKGDDPVSEEARSLLDGHIVLLEKSATAGIWPAVDILRSVSRVFAEIAPKQIVNAAAALKRIKNAYEENEDLILMGAYHRGTSKDTDYALDRKTQIEAFLGQQKGDTSSLDETFCALLGLVGMEFQSRS